MYRSVKSEEILYLSFNQNNEYFSCGTTSGFRIYKTIPLEQTHSTDLNGGVGIVEMLYKTNVLALVGGGPNPAYPLNKVIIWDDQRSEAIGEMCFKFMVKAVKLTLRKVIVAIETKIYLHHLIDLKLMDSVDTAVNPLGLCCFSLKEDILCYPDKEIGHFRLKFYDKEIKIADMTNSQTISKKAHSTALRYLAINESGDKIATASEKGTLIRVFNAKNGMLLQELRRGSENHKIQCIVFDPTSEWLGCTSDTGTLHVFKLFLQDNDLLNNSTMVENSEIINDSAMLNNSEISEISKKNSIAKKSIDKASNSKTLTKNKTSRFAFMKVFHRYFGSEWSYSHIKKLSDKPTKFVFGLEKNQIIVCGYDGKYHDITFNSKENGGNKVQYATEFLKQV